MATLQSADAMVFISSPKSFLCKTYDVCVVGKSFSPQWLLGSLLFVESSAELTLSYSVHFVKLILLILWNLFKAFQSKL